MQNEFLYRKETKRALQLITPIPNTGFSGFRALSSASGFVSVDNDSLRNPLLGIAVTLAAKINLDDIKLHYR
jgi:hypothetical protein